MKRTLTLGVAITTNATKVKPLVCFCLYETYRIRLSSITTNVTVQVRI